MTAVHFPSANQELRQNIDSAQKIEFTTDTFSFSIHFVVVVVDLHYFVPTVGFKMNKNLVLLLFLNNPVFLYYDVIIRLCK